MSEKVDKVEEKMKIFLLLLIVIILLVIAIQIFRFINIYKKQYGML